jgi:hypothetical protein
MQLANMWLRALLLSFIGWLLAGRVRVYLVSNNNNCLLQQPLHYPQLVHSPFIFHFITISLHVLFAIHVFLST